jgi:hypothetical protein
VTYVVVVKRENSPEPAKIYRGKLLARVLQRIKRDRVPPNRDTVRWTPAMDDCVLSLYRTIPKSALATILSEQFKRRVTKNAVISRYHALRSKNK